MYVMLNLAIIPREKKSKGTSYLYRNKKGIVIFFV
jgi:hypothetical protein